MSGQYIELERAYLDSGKKPGYELTVDLAGRYLERPAMDNNSNIIMLIVDEFKQISENQDCSPPHHAELFNTYWKLIELNGKPALPDRAAEQEREAHMVLNEAEQRINGHGGCNRFFGQFTREGDKLAFTGLGSTMMACASGMENEQAFLLALGDTNRAEVSGQFLQLFKGDQILARFEAVYF
jgi:heat shock protein HslJ